MPSRIFKIGGVFLALVILIIIGAIVFINNLPEVAEQLKANASPVIVTLTQPLNGGTWERNLPIPIEASAMPFTSVASIELWVDGTQTQTLTSKTGSAEWTVALQTEGEHTFFVRAIDTKGRVANSNVVRVSASHATDPGATLLQPAKSGDTIASLAANFHTTPQDIIDLNPGLDPAAALPPGNPIKIPIQPPPLPPVNNPTSPLTPSGPTQPGSNKPPGKFAFWVSQFFSPKPPVAPELALQVNQCAVNLSITPKSKLAQSTNVYRFDAAANVFIKIATLADSNGSPIGYTDPHRNGHVLYYVSAFNAAGESPSNIVSTDITDPVCLTPFWIGVKLGKTPPKLTQFVGTNPIIIPTKYDQAYFYLSINNSGSFRLPPDPNTFLTLPDGFFIPDEQIKTFVQPAAEDLAVEIDAWGWSAGQLLHIGTFQRTVPALKQKNTAPADYTASELRLCDIVNTIYCGSEGLSEYVTEASSSDYVAWPFRWLPDPSNADHGLWQVAVSAFPNDCDVNPPGLIASGQLDAVGGHYAKFTVDFALLKDKLPNGGDSASIRIIPVANGQPICQPSNTVKFNIVAPQIPGTLPPPPPPLVAFEANIVEFKPIQPANINYQNCVVIIKNPYLDDPNYYFGTKGTPAEPWHYYPVGATLCPKNYAAKSKSLWDYIEDSVNFVSDVFSTLKDYAVTLTDELNPWCISAKLTSDAIQAGKKTVKDVCHAIAEATVDIGLAYVGLPPSLPNYDELENASKGYVADLAVDQLGEDCPDKDVCKKLIQQGMDFMIAKVKESQNGSQCFNKALTESKGYYPICEPQGAITQPSPYGQIQPAVVKIQITRHEDLPSSDFPDHSQYVNNCNFNLDSTADNNSLIGQQIEIGVNSQSQPVYWTGQAISGELFKRVSAKIPKLSVGETVIVPFALTPASTDYDSFRHPPYDVHDSFWIPEHLANLNYWASIDQTAVHGNDDWRYLYSGAAAALNLKGSCQTMVQGKAAGLSTFSAQYTLNPLPSIGP